MFLINYIIPLRLGCNCNQDGGFLVDFGVHWPVFLDHHQY